MYSSITAVFAAFFMMFGLSSLAFGQNTKPDEIKPPDRETRLENLLPIIKGIYENTDVYTAQRNYSKEWDEPEFRYFVRTKKPFEEVITLQVLKDITGALDLIIQRREPMSWRTNETSTPLPALSLFNNFNAFPDDLIVVLEPGNRGCVDVCRSILLNRKAESVIIIETEKSNSAPEFKTATRYSLDSGRCKRSTKKNGFSRFDNNDDETLNEHANGLSARPALRLCFTYKSVDIPNYGAFIYLNTASPLWPEHLFEREQTRTEVVPDAYRASYRVVNPKAFTKFETSFTLSNMRHISLEYRVPDIPASSRILIEAGCINTIPHFPKNAMQLMLDTHEPEIFQTYLTMDQRKLSVAKYGSGFCFGDYSENGSVFQKEDLEFNPLEVLSDQEVIKSLTEAYSQFSHDPTEYYELDLRGELMRLQNEGLSGSLAQGLFPIYRDLIIKHDKTWPVELLTKFPEGSLSGDIDDLNKIRDHILDKIKCLDADCKIPFRRDINTSPSVRIYTNHPWGRAAAIGAGIYSAAGPKAVPDLEIALREGLDGAVYALGCMRAKSSYIEMGGVNILRNSFRYPQIRARHLLSMRFSDDSEAYRQMLLDDLEMRKYRNLSEQLWPLWDSKQSLCVYRGEM